MNKTDALLAVIAALLACILAVLLSCACRCGMCGAVSLGKWYAQDDSGQLFEVCRECYHEERLSD